MICCEAERLFELSQQLQSILGRTAISFKRRYQRLLLGNAAPEHSSMSSR